MNRTPRKPIRQALRKEVGFVCPVPGCGNPYLTWHHFDPPWNKQHHENPAGIIALCAEHHHKADRGTWTVAQLRKFKHAGRGSQNQVKGKFDWMRDQFLGVLGGNFVLETPTLFYCSAQPIIWFQRDRDGYLRVNLRRPLTNRTAELIMQNNDWMLPPDVADIECPPSGRILEVSYPNGDFLSVEFCNLSSVEEAVKRYPGGSTVLPSLQYPLVAVDFQVKMPALNINVDPNRMVLPGNAVYTGCWAGHCDIGFAVGEVIHPGSVGFRLAHQLV